MKKLDHVYKNVNQAFREILNKYLKNVNQVFGNVKCV